MPTPSPSHVKTKRHISAEADRPGVNVRRIHVFEMEREEDDHEGVSDNGRRGSPATRRGSPHLRGNMNSNNNAIEQGGNELEALVNGTGGSSTALPSPRRLPYVADDDDVAKSAPFKISHFSNLFPSLSFRAQVIAGFVGVFFILLASALVGRYPIDDANQGGASVSDEAVDSCPTIAVEDIDALLAKIRAQSQAVRCYNNNNDDDKGRSQVTKSCKCSNPVVAADYTGIADWNRGFLRNVQLAREAVAKGRKLDVVMLGDSIVEYWQSTYRGSTLGRYQTNHEIYLRLFDSPDAPIQGLALGVAGDKCNQLLYRIQNGIIEGLHPKVFWVLIGTNDVLGSACDADQVVAGNVAIIRELQKQLPDATAVVQALLPVGDAKAIVLPEVYSEINRRLACAGRWMNGRDDSNAGSAAVEFVNVTELFLTPSGPVNETLLPDKLHPSADGSEVWGQAIVRNVLRIIK